MDPRNSVMPQTPLNDQPSTSQQLPYPPPQMHHYQQHAMHSRYPYPPSQQYGPSTPSNRLNNVQSWQQNHFDSGFHSMSASQNPSIMSYADSQMSMQSMNSTMSEVPPIHLTQLSEQAQARINRFRAFFKGGDPIKVKQAIPDLLIMMDDADADEDVITYSIGMLKDVIRSDYSRPQNVPPVIDNVNVAFTVKNIMCRFKNNKWIVRCCLGIFFFLPVTFVTPVIRQCKEEVLDILTNGVTISEHGAYRYAIMVLNSLIQSKEISTIVIQYLRDQKALGFIADRLGDTTVRDKMLSIIVDTIQKICLRNEEQRSFFVVNLSGIQKLIQILATHSYKPLISNVLTLLHSIAVADSSQIFYSKQIVDAGIFDYVPRHLAISDDSTLSNILKLLWAISDISTKSDLKPLLELLIQKISHPNLKFKQWCLDSISNFIANKSDLKLFIVQRNVTMILVQLMEQMDMPFNNDKRIVEKIQVRAIERIQEAALTILSHLCSSHAEERAIVQYLPQTNLRFILLKKLTEKRPAILKHTLNLILKICSNRKNIVILKTTVINFEGEHWYIPVICNILNISTEQIDAEIEDVKIHILAKLSLEILANFCIDRSIAEIVFKIFTENSGIDHPILPAVLLTKEGTNYLKAIKISSLKLLIELANCGAPARYISGNDLVLESLGHIKNSEISELVVLADQVLEKATKTCQNPPPPSYRTDQILPSQPIFHSQQNNPQFYEQYSEAPPPYVPTTYPPPIYPQTGGDSYVYPTCHPGYSQPSGYQSPSNYENQPMSIGAPQAVTMMSMNEGPKHEELAYIHPLEDPIHIYPSAQSATMPMDHDYATMAPQPSPFQMCQVMQWNWEGE